MRKMASVIVHNCKEFDENKEKYGWRGHNIPKEIYSCGGAIDEIQYNEKANLWHTYNNEYATIINFCPFCGIKLEIK